MTATPCDQGRFSGVRTLLTVLLVLLPATTARADDEVLGPMPGSPSLSAYGGWVVHTVEVDEMTQARRLMAWHEGSSAPVGFAEAPYDFDVGPDASGRPTVVYSRCARGGPRSRPDGCDLYAVRLNEGIERRLSVSSKRHSEFAPSIWRGSIAFGRLSPGQRKADVMLKRPGRPLKRLGAGTLAKCFKECGPAPPTARPLYTDLGPRALAYLWELNGGQVVGTEYGLEMRIARLDGSRAKIANSGYFGGACGFEQPLAPNVAGTAIVYGHAHGGECEESHESIRRFTHRRARRSQLRLPAGSSTVIARDAANGDLYRVQDGQLIRSRGLAFERIKGGEAEPPIF
jgi:hypothetical protein